jgi:ATP-dependent Clp protease ATP-binding subunit ClpC
VKDEVESLIATADKADKWANTPRVSMAKKVLESAIEEARSMEHRYIGTEHILLGFLHQPDCIVAITVMNLGLSLSQLREGVHDFLGDRI